MKNIIFGFLAGLCVIPILGIVFLLAGGMPVATKGPPLPMEKWIAKIALHVAIKDEEDKPSPIPADEVNLLAGAKVYMNQCSVCHGGIEHKASFIAKGLFPKPPQLFDPEHLVTDDPVGESYWKIKNGIRLTGMPGFVDNLTDTEMWQVSQLLVSADKLPESVSQILSTNSK